jgi:hypothetical protein
MTELKVISQGSGRLASPLFLSYETKVTRPRGRSACKRRPQRSLQGRPYNNLPPQLLPNGTTLNLPPTLLLRPSHFSSTEQLFF